MPDARCPITYDIGIMSNSKTRRVLLALCAFALVMNLWGIRRDLPYVHNYDEQPFVLTAYGMAVTGGWDPHWFGHPGTTMIYPLRVLFSCWIAYAHGGRDFLQAAVASPEVAFQAKSYEYFYLGRLLSIAYLVASVPVLCFMARRMFGGRTAVWGSLLWIVMPLIVAQAQITRSDTAVMFFGYLAIGLLFRYLEAPSQKLRLWVAAMIGCAVSSHYKMACLGPLWFWTEWHVCRQKKLVETPSRQLLQVFTAGLFCGLVFLVLNPYLFVHLDAVRKNLASETPLQHPGADGLTPMGNLSWYLFEAIPGAFGWIAYALAGAGGVLVLFRGTFGQKLLPGFIALYLFGIMWSPLHWDRWITVILPALCFLAIHALFKLLGRFPEHHRRWPQVAGLAVILLPPFHQLVFQNIRNASFNTRMQAFEWVLKNVPKGSKIAYEWYTVPFKNQPYYQAVEVHALPAHGDLKTYRLSGYHYLIVSSNMYHRFLDDPKRFKLEARFYQDLFSSGNLQAAFVPSSTVGGSEIRVYRID